MFIKCPECRQQVSTFAGTCPHCNTRISGHLRNCPKCGAFCLCEQDKCPKCGEALEPEPKQLPGRTCPYCRSYIPYEYGNRCVCCGHALEPEPKPRKKRKFRTKALAVICTALCLMLGVAGGYFLYQKQEKQKVQDAYEKLADVSNPDFYQEFLDAYPESEYVEEINERMLALQAEQEAWLQVTKKPTRKNILHFMEEHPTSLRLCMCEDMIDSMDWAKAQANSSAEAIDTYLESHPAGRYASEAAELKNALMLTKITSNDKALLRGTLEAFFAYGIAKQDTAAINHAIPGTMKDFCGIANADAECIARYAREQMTKEAMGQHFLVSQDLDIKKELLPDGEIGFAVAFSLNETVSNENPNKTSAGTYRVTALLNFDQKIIRMTIKQ